MAFDRDQFNRAFKGLGNKKPKEAKLQEQVVNYLLAKYPKVRFISSLTGENQGDRYTRARNSRIQHSPGQPDIMIFAPVGTLALELKNVNIWKKDGNLYKSEHLEAQAGWLEYLQECGITASFAVGLDNSMKIIDLFLSGKHPVCRVRRGF